MLDSALFTVRSWKNATCLLGHFARYDFKKSPPFQKYEMKLYIIQCYPWLSHVLDHGILRGIVFGPRQLRAKILSNWWQINKPRFTPRAVAARTIIFQSEIVKKINSLFHSVYPVVPKSLFSIADLFAVRYLRVICTRSWNFAWHLLLRSSTERKNIIILLEISQTIHTVCYEDDYLFQRENLNYLILCFTQCTLLFQKSWFSIADLFAVRYLWVVCNKDKCCVVTQRAADIRVACLVTSARIACLLQFWIKTSELDYSIWTTPKW